MVVAAVTAATVVEAAVPSRVTQVVRDTETVLLVGNTLGIVDPKADLGPVSATQKLGHMFVLLRRSPVQDQALAAFNEHQYDAASPDYHHWLSAEEFGLAYGPSDSDVAAVTAWLSRAGFQIFDVTKGRTQIEFTGTVEQVQNAFQLEIHRYDVKGVTHYANDRDPQIPQALAAVIGGITGINDLTLNTHMRPGHYVKRDHVSGQFVTLKTTPARALPALKGKQVQPQFTFTEDGNQIEYVTPYDFATIYNSLPLWNASTPVKGSGVSIAIVGDNDVNLNDIATYRKTFGLPAYTPTIHHVGSDPGGSSGENTLDLEMVSASAPNAKITLVVPEGASTIGGILSSASYIVDNEIAPIMSASYGLCELTLGTSNNSQFNQLWQQAATEGISVFVSSGDQGSAGCSQRQANTPDDEGLEVNGMASSPYVTAVGGTDFAWEWIVNGASTYWNSTNDSHGASAKGYVPELPWNVNCANPLLQSNYFVNSSGPLFTTPTEVCNAVIGTEYAPFLTIGGGSGGYSHCTTPSGSNPGSCAGGYAKPSWQTGTGVPSDGKRDVPDVALFASYGYPDFTDGGPLTPLVIASEIMWCYSGSGHACVYDDYQDIVFQGNGGTSAATPYWAGIMAMIVQKQNGAKQGLANPILYKLAAGESLTSCGTNSVKSGNSCIFYDITNFDNAQGCIDTAENCANEGAELGVLPGYNATKGYDQATGLGSVNIANLVDKWPSSGSSAAVKLSATSLAFGNQSAGSTSASKSVTVTNSGSASLTLSSIALTGAQADDFALSKTCGGSLSAGASCTFSVTFKPVSSGAKVASVTLTDNASGSPQSVALTGTGTSGGAAPAVKLSATSLAFGDQAAGSFSAAKSVTLTNSGSGSLTLSSIGVTGAQADDFVLSKTCGNSLSAGASCTISVEFAPVSSGSKVASVTITDNASGSPQAIALTGTGT
jgi:subtilase family serine protease